MPRPLMKTPPTSSVARLLDVGAASRAMTSSTPQVVKTPIEISSQQPIQPFGEFENGTGANSVPLPNLMETASIKREIILSLRTDETFSTLIEMYRRGTGTRLSASQVARAILRGVSKCLATLQREATELGRLKLPSNARGREGERDRFEDSIAQAFVNGISAAAAYRRDE